MSTKLERRYREVFHQTPRADLVVQVAREIFDSRLRPLYWTDLRPGYAERVSASEIAAVAEGYTAIYSPASNHRLVLGAALYRCYHSMNEAQYTAFAADVRAALRKRIVQAISAGQTRDIVGRMITAGMQS